MPSLQVATRPGDFLCCKLCCKQCCLLVYRRFRVYNTPMPGETSSRVSKPLSSTARAWMEQYSICHARERSPPLWCGQDLREQCRTSSRYQRQHHFMGTLCQAQSCLQLRLQVKLSSCNSMQTCLLWSLGRTWVSSARPTGRLHLGR